jgi:hypothetical protein
MTRAQKLQWYAGQLMTDAGAAERSGNNDAALSSYLQAADILLLLSKVEQNYPTWKSYTDRADYCQHRAKALIALRSE